MAEAAVPAAVAFRGASSAPTNILAEVPGGVPGEVALNGRDAPVVMTSYCMKTASPGGGTLPFPLKEAEAAATGEEDLGGVGRRAPPPLPLPAFRDTEAVKGRRPLPPLPTPD